MEEERDKLRREVQGLEEMLGQVLLAVGEPVVVTKESLAQGTKKGSRIRIDDRVELEAFVFYVEVPDDGV